MEQVKVKFKKLDSRAVIPSYAHYTDAGMDLTAIDIEYDKDLDCFVYHTGLAIEVPEGYYINLYPRSSNRKTDAYLTNSVGVVDSNYRGEVLLCFKSITSIKVAQKFHSIIGIINNMFTKLGFPDIKLDDYTGYQAPYNVGDRIAQMIVLSYPKVDIEVVDNLSSSDRGNSGFGSTGK